MTEVLCSFLFYLIEFMCVHETLFIVVFLYHYFEWNEIKQIKKYEYDYDQITGHVKI